MAGPWEEYRQQTEGAAKAGPWTEYADGTLASNDMVSLSDRDGKGFLEKLDAGARGAADTLTFGYADEIAAGLSSGFGAVGDYDEDLAQERAVDRFDEENNTYSRLAGQLAGALVPGVGVARAVAPYLAGKSAATVAGAGVGGGALYGSAYGLGSGEDTKGRISEAAKGAVIGAGAGALGTVAAKGAGWAANKLLRSKRAAQELAEVGLSDESADLVRRALVNDNANISNIADGGMLADVTPTGRSMLDAYIQRGGRAVGAAKDAIEQRAAAARNNVNAVLDEVMGKPIGTGTIVREIKEGSAEKLANVYDAAYSQPIDYASTKGRLLEQLITNRVPARAIREANELMRISGEQSKQILAKVGDDGTVTFERLPDVRQIDYITRALGDMASKSDGAGKLGGQTAKGAKLEALSRKIRDAAKSLVPEYKTALDTAADAISQRKAVEFGAKLLQPGVSRDEVLRLHSIMGKAERQAAKQGVRSFIDERLSNVYRTITDGNVEARQAVSAIKLLTTDANKSKLRMVLGRDASKVSKVIDEAATALDLRASIATNSRTYGRQAAQSALDDMATPGLLRTFVERGERGGVMEGAKAIARKAFDSDTLTAKQDKVVEEVVNALTGSRSGDAKQIAAKLVRSGATQQRAEDAARRISYILGGGVTGGATAAGSGPR